MRFIGEVFGGDFRIGLLLVLAGITLLQVCDLATGQQHDEDQYATVREYKPAVSYRRQTYGPPPQTDGYIKYLCKTALNPDITKINTAVTRLKKCCVDARNNITELQEAVEQIGSGGGGGGGGEGTPPACCATLQASVDSLQAQINSLKDNELKNLQTCCDINTVSISSLTTTVSNLQETVNDLSDKVNNLPGPPFQCPKYFLFYKIAPDNNVAKLQVIQNDGFAVDTTANKANLFANLALFAHFLYDAAVFKLPPTNSNQDPRHIAPTLDRVRRRKRGAASVGDEDQSEQDDHHDTSYEKSLFAPVVIRNLNSSSNEENRREKRFIPVTAPIVTGVRGENSIDQFGSLMIQTNRDELDLVNSNIDSFFSIPANKDKFIFVRIWLFNCQEVPVATG